MDHIVYHLRLPRTVLATLTGASLAVAGALAQTWTRNPLAAPGFIGITSGAGCAVSVGLTLGAAQSMGSISVLALIGAAVAAVIVLLAARAAGGTGDPTTLILAGLGVTAALSALTLLLTISSTRVLDGMRQWTVGSTFGRGSDEIVVALVGLIIGAIIAIAVARPLDLLAMGDETATTLGARPVATAFLAAVGIVILAGTATAAVGPVAFVGFAAPHIVRLLIGPGLTTSLVPVALTGGFITLIADMVGRVIVAPSELEMSIILAIVGAPILIWVVKRAGMRGEAR